jgi:hypothetical protein
VSPACFRPVGLWSSDGTLRLYAHPEPVKPIVQRVRALEAAGYELVSASLPSFNWRLTFCARLPVRMD